MQLVFLTIELIKSLFWVLQRCSMLLLAFLISLCMGDESVSMTPNFKWSQSNETILITAYYDPSKILRLKDQANIVLENKDFTPVTKDFSIEEEWLRLSWNNFNLELHLRENIIAKQSWCKWKEQYVVCSLRKQYEHIFDYLSTRDQVGRLKKYCTKDWEASDVGEDQDEQEFEQIDRITMDEIKAIEESSKSVIIHAYYPWCQHCWSEQQTFEETKREFSRK
eukprot:UN31243